MYSSECCVGGCVATLPVFPAIDDPLVVAINREWCARMVEGE